MKYKLTDADGYTRRDKFGETLWVPGVWHEATGTGVTLCTDGWIHWYDHPLLAMLFNPINAEIENPRMWECEIGGEVLLDHGIKGGSKRCRVMREIPVPQISTEQRITFAVLCTLKVYQSEWSRQWIMKWLSERDRKAVAAWATGVAVTAATAKNLDLIALACKACGVEHD